MLEVFVNFFKVMPPVLFWYLVCMGVLLPFLALSVLAHNRRRRKASRREFITAAENAVEDTSESVPEPVIDTTAFPPIKEESKTDISEPTPTKTLPSTPEKAFKPEPEPRKKAPEKISSAGLFKRLKSGLAKTRRSLSGGIDSLFTGRGKIDDALLEDLEELLITSDIGVQTTASLIDDLSGKAKDISDPDQLKNVLKSEIGNRINREYVPRPGFTDKPHVIMVVGVNGVGKTTTIGKLAHGFSADGKKVLLAAADTFRAAAIEQLTVWADRAGADLIKHREGTDPAAVVFDAMEAGTARGSDVIIVDTAGRLHTKTNLMEELKKIKRIISKKIPDAPHEILLVLDAATGQNAVVQTEQFHKALGVTGLVMTKLDGTARGGVVISILATHKIPLYFVGVGEGINDLQPFDPQKFVEAFF